MKVIYNSWIPFRGYSAINICGVVFAREELGQLPISALRHEEVHTRQMKRAWYLWFYLRYLGEWLYYLWKLKDARAAYYAISYEREAYGCGEKSPN